MDAALRESYEELGLDKKDIEIWTSLPSMARYGNTGCGVFKKGYKIRKVFD